jgi:hypothetical protein
MRFCLVSLVVCVSCAHRGPAGPPGPPQQMVEHLVRPEIADPAADRWLQDQYAYLGGGAPPAHQLVVYLVGANNKPQSGRVMMKELARLGFAVLAPMYANDYPIRDLCEKPESDPDDDCHGKARLEAFEGQDASPHIEVSRPNSIEERVARMLAILQADFPAEGWGAFLDGGRPRWSDIVIAGHSHGASSAALVGKVRSVARVVMLSGPYDNRAGEPAPWIARPGQTPLARVYGLTHENEEQHAGHLKNWKAMGLDGLGAATFVDSSTPPYGQSHQLSTAVAAKNPHGSTGAGPASPRRPDGVYQLDPVWRYLFGR